MPSKPKKNAGKEKPKINKERLKNGRFRKGHKGYLSAWKGDEACYASKHMWIYAHYGKADRCENPNCTFKNPRRYEWANLSGKHIRERKDYIRLCPSCHRKMDLRKITFKQLCALK